MNQFKAFIDNQKQFQYFVSDNQNNSFQEHQFKQMNSISGRIGYLITYVDKTNEYIDAPTASAAYKIATTKKEVEKISYHAIRM